MTQHEFHPEFSAEEEDKAVMDSLRTSAKWHKPAIAASFALLVANAVFLLLSLFPPNSDAAAFLAGIVLALMCLTYTSNTFSAALDAAKDGSKVKAAEELASARRTTGAIAVGALIGIAATVFIFVSGR